ncbi:MAG TPA: alpha/beta hydrolase [Aquabacterium sp.]|jgi:pimeloyl-ACP methyl ester carboxylesterase|uniref:alpha/beta fold hydrolase n=1 Tax=Aquabacterium sp. TaxID=1872578 RepID=UPI002D939797|nr:alpha/beta hydrolase [Aquabacterium sp.]HET6786388.1 alpha/beta hydrolase [Aquabacterium sp.]HEX5373798.1 alpha/beta hydrolase [Aquabacterium sp.]
MKTLLKATLGVVLLALLALGVGLAMNWAPDRSVAELSPRWAPQPSRFVLIDGMQVHLRDEGRRDDPEPIVLLHGTSASLHTWDGWVAALAPGRRVIRMDLPGFGLTGPAPDGDYSLPRYATFVTHLMDQLGVQRAVLVGNSFGGAVAWKTAADHPARVSRLILIDAGGYPYESASVPIGFRLARYPALSPILNNVLPRSMIESSVRNVYGDPERVTAELVERYYELTLRAGNRQALVERFRQSPGGEFAAQIPQIQAPTLILWGGRDRLIPPSTAQRFRQDIRGSALVVFDTLGHVPHEEDPAHTVTVAQAFLETPR